MTRREHEDLYAKCEPLIEAHLGKIRWMQPDDLADVRQQCRVWLWGVLPDYDAERGTLAHWVNVGLANVVKMYQRGESRRAKALPTVELLDGDEEEGTGGPEARYGAFEGSLTDWMDVQRVLDGLPREHRAAAELLMQGHDAASMAAVMGWSPVQAARYVADLPLMLAGMQPAGVRAVVDKAGQMGLGL